MKLRDLWVLYLTVFACWLLCVGTTAYLAIRGEWLEAAFMALTATAIAYIPGRWVAGDLKRHPDYK